MDIYLDTQTMGMRLTYRGGKRPLRSSGPTVSRQLASVPSHLIFQFVLQTPKTSFLASKAILFFIVCVQVGKVDI